jgi:RNA polymerase sigma-70 factor (ECF subfamily)
LALSDSTQEDEFFKMVKHHQGIFNKVLGLYTMNAEDRKDLQQEMLLQCWKSFGSYKAQSKISTWLYRVCLNTALNYHKKTKKHKYTDINLASDRIANNKSKSEYEDLYKAIIQLNEVDRMIISLYLDGYKNKEISGITGMNENKLNVKIHRIKQKLAQHLKSENNG